MRAQNKSAVYTRMRDTYFTNAEKFAAEGEFRKASELLWGAVTQAIKALAAKLDRKIETHAQFYSFMERLAKELRQQDLYESFLFLNDLHKNFYDEKIRPVDFEIYLGKTFSFCRRLQELMEKPPVKKPS